MPYLNREQILELIKKKQIYSDKINISNQIQPASLDLTLSKKCYRIKASFIPNNKKISEVIKELSLTKIDLSQNTLLEKNCIYLCELNEKLSLPKDIMGKSNPKSTTGRLDIFTRIITENGKEYDYVNYNYKGKLYLEIIPQSFSIVIKKNLSLNQIRFFRGPYVENKIRQINLSVSIKKNQISAYKAKKITSAIDLNKIKFYKSDKYWEKVIPQDNYFIIERDEFYILRSKEAIHIKNNQAAELEPFKDSFGNFRVHYAGFFDPGFGNNKSGTPAVLELRAYDTPFIIRDGQLVGQLNYYEIDEIKKDSYGINIKSNYFNQNLKLAKQFK
jgi:dCTP deaminase